MHNNLNYRSEKRLKRLQNDSTVDLISFTMVAREAGTISLWLVYSSNITVYEARALSEGGDTYQDVALLLRSIIAGFQITRELQTGRQQLTKFSWRVLKSSFSNTSSHSLI